MIRLTPPFARLTDISMSLRVTDPSSPAKPSQVAERTKRFSSVIALIVVVSNRFAIQSPA
jgi:hypothetical protein